MIIDRNKITIMEEGAGFIVAKAKETDTLLKKGERIQVFDGVRSSLKYVQEFLPIPGHGSSSVNRGKSGFNLFGSYDEAMDIFINKSESVVKYNQTNLEPRDFLEQGNELEYDVTGDFIDIGRVMEGVPEAFGSLHNGLVRARRVRLIVSIDQVCTMDEKDINHRGERIVRLVDALEATHVRTEIVAMCSGECVHFEVTVKRFDEPFTIEDLAVATHSEYFRRPVFRMIEHSDTYWSGYGNPRNLGGNTNIFRKQLTNNELTIYINGDIPGSRVDIVFDDLEKALEVELSKQIPDIGFIDVREHGVKLESLQ